MRMMSKRLAILAAVALLSVGMTACGSSKSMYITDEVAESPMTAPSMAAQSNGTGGMKYGAAAQEFYDDSLEEEYAYNDDGGTDTRITDTAESSRKLVYNASLDVETTDYESLLAAVKSAVTEYGGYIESQNASDYSRYGTTGNRGRSAWIDARIPVAHYEDFMQGVSEQSHVLNRSENVDDITLNYVDQESRLGVYRTEQERLMDFLKSAETVEDMISIEARLSEVNANIESIESRLRTMDNQVDYATVNVSISEVIIYTETKEPELTPVERMTQGFKRSFDRMLIGLQNFGIAFVINLPYIILWVVIILVIILVISGIIKHSIKKSRKRKQGKQEAPQASPYTYTYAGASVPVTPVVTVPPVPPMPHTEPSEAAADGEHQ